MTRTEELRTQTLALVRALDPERMSGADAAAVVQDLAVIEKAAATGRMFAAMRVAKTDAWRGQGHASAADWLAAQAGITVREAHAQLGTAEKANRLGKTKDQMRAGKLSPDQAAAVADAATADPDAEDSLLDAAANDTTAKLKDEAARIKAAATDSATRERRIRAERSVRTRTDRDGAFCLHLRGPAADGVRLLSLLRPYEEQAFRTGRTDGVRDSFENRSYDAFQACLADLQAGAGHGDQPAPAPADGPSAPGPAAPSSTRPDPAAPPSSARGQAGVGAPAPALASAGPTAPDPVAGAGRPAGPGDHGGRDAAPARAGTGGRPAGPVRPAGGNNVKVIVRIDHTALVRGHTVAGETCEVAGVGPISAGAVRELLQDDSFLAAVVTKGRDVVTVAHLGRGLNAHQRTAIEALGLRCANRACNRTVALQIDHRVPYAQVPETRLDNQDPLCPDCHRRKTHHGWHLEPGTGPRRFLPPDEPQRPPTSGRTDRGTRPPEGQSGQSDQRQSDRGTGPPEVGKCGDGDPKPGPGTHQPSLL